MKVRWVQSDKGLEEQKVTVQIKEVSLGLSTLSGCDYGYRDE